MTDLVTLECMSERVDVSINEGREMFVGTDDLQQIRWMVVREDIRIGGWTYKQNELGIDAHVT